MPRPWMPVAVCTQCSSFLRWTPTGYVACPKGHTRLIRADGRRGAPYQIFDKPVLWLHLRRSQKSNNVTNRKLLPEGVTQ